MNIAKTTREALRPVQDNFGKLFRRANAGDERHVWLEGWRMSLREEGLVCTVAPDLSLQMSYIRKSTAIIMSRQHSYNITLLVCILDSSVRPSSFRSDIAVTYARFLQQKLNLNDILGEA